MARYRWEGIGPDGKSATGVVVGDTPEMVRRQLQRKRIRATQVEPEREAPSSITPRRRLIKDRDLAVFTRQFAVMVDAGLPLVEALEELGSESEHKHFKVVVEDVRKQVEAGSSLGRALRRHPRAFSDLYCSIVEAGEASGSLEAILHRLADYIESVAALKSAVRSASIYPAIVVSVAIMVVLVMLWKVIPTFAGLFAALGAQLPLPTRIVIAISHFLGAFFPFVLAGMLGLALSVRQAYKTEAGQRFIDAQLLRIPVIGVLLHKIAVARACRTLATLTTSGVPILESLQIASRTSGNRVVGDATLRVRDAVEAGRSISATMKKDKIFPGMVSRMIAVGERTGQLETMLNKVSEFYEKEVKTATDNLTSLLEPVMIVFLGIVIGGIVISMYLPMFELVSRI